MARRPGSPGHAFGSPLLSRMGDAVVVPEASGLPPVLDLFCGAGGMSLGLRQAGFDCSAGIDVNAECQYAYEHNVQAPFAQRRVEGLTPADLRRMAGVGSDFVIAASPPCQSFSLLGKQPPKPLDAWSLARTTLELIRAVRPPACVLENVPHMRNFGGGHFWQQALADLDADGYHIAWGCLNSHAYGTPQRRQRLILIASRRGPLSLPAQSARPRPTVRDAIGDLPAIASGGADPDDALHRCSELSPLNLERIRASKPGGTWHDWPRRLWLPCQHRGETQRNGGGWRFRKQLWTDGLGPACAHDHHAVPGLLLRSVWPSPAGPRHFAARRRTAAGIPAAFCLSCGKHRPQHSDDRRDGGQCRARASGPAHRLCAGLAPGRVDKRTSPALRKRGRPPSRERRQPLGPAALFTFGRPLG